MTRGQLGHLGHLDMQSFRRLHGLPTLSHFSATRCRFSARETGWSAVSPASTLAHLPCCHPAQCWVGPKDSVTMRPHSGQRCMDVFPNTWGHPGYAQLHLVKPIAALAIARNCKANVWQLFPLRDAGDMCTEAPRNTKMPIPKERSIRSACKCWRPMQSRAAVFRLTLVHVKHNRPEQVQWKTRKKQCFVVPLTFKCLSAVPSKSLYSRLWIHSFWTNRRTRKTSQGNLPISPNRLLTMSNLL